MNIMLINVFMNLLGTVTPKKVPAPPRNLEPAGRLPHDMSKTSHVIY